MTIREAFDATVADTIQKLVTGVAGLLNVRRTGKGGQGFADSKKLFLSGREEQTDSGFADAGVRAAESNPSGVFPYSLGATFEFADYLRGIPIIHKRRGTSRGLTADIKRMCNTTSSSATLHPQTECGWILGVTSPGFEPGGSYGLDVSLVFLGLDNMLDVLTENKGNRKDVDVKHIIRHELVPARLNVRSTVLPSLGVGEAPVGVAPVGSTG